MLTKNPEVVIKYSKLMLDHNYITWCISSVI